MGEDYDDNVLTYIYKLNEHLNVLKYLLQGITPVDGKKDKFIRVTDPIAPDDFIYTQINGLSSVLSNHNFVGQITTPEKNNIILDTFAAFVENALNEEFFDWNKFNMVSESFYNTLHLFLNTLIGGYGAQFTIAAQSGITTKIPIQSSTDEIKPYVDVPSMFGVNKNIPQTPPAYNNPDIEQ